jgi:hypothetical protein
MAVTQKKGIEEVVIQMDNYKGHNSAKTKKRLEKFQVTWCPHPPYSPDISPCDF